MSINSYEFFEELYAGIKPIRGRAVEVRPIGKRSRDWEQVTRNLQADGKHSYVARLFQTDVVEYFANGDVVLRSGDWATPTTAEFIHEHSPFSCWKRHNKLWVNVRGSSQDEDGPTVYPIDKELRLKQVGEHRYEPYDPVVIKKRVVDREKAKAARSPLKPFLAWAKSFLTLSDGWVMHETMKVALGFSTDRRAGGYEMERKSLEKIYELLTKQGDVEPDAIYLIALCQLAESYVVRTEGRTAEVIKNDYGWNREYIDRRIEFENIRRVLHNHVRKMDSAGRIVEVMPGKFAVHGAV